MIDIVERLLNNATDDLIALLRNINRYTLEIQEIKKAPHLARGADKKIFTKEDFLKRRFPNQEGEYKQYINRQTLSGPKVGDLSTEGGEEVAGSISYRPKEDRFMGRFYFLGKRYHVYAKTKTECASKMRSKRAELKGELNNSNTLSKKMHLNYWFEYWMENFKKQTIKQSTYKKSIEIFNRHVKDSIGTKSINNIKPSDVQKFINDIDTPTPREKVYRMLRDLFNLLEKEKYIKTNPMNLVVLPKENTNDDPIQIEKKDKILSYENELRLYEHCKKGQKRDQYGAAIKLVLYSGLRRGECIGLIWDNINFEKGTILVDRQFNMDTKRITDTKTTASYRIIPMMPAVKKLLQELYNKKDKGAEYVFSDIERMTQNLNNYGKSLGFELNPHMLRHTYASRCYAAGLDPKIIQDLLGHETLSTTLDTYTHVLYDEQDVIIKEYREFFIGLNYIKE